MATEIARQLARFLLRHRPPKACVLLGPRGAGKTTILRMLAEGRAASWFDGDDGAVAAEQLRLPSSADVRSLLMHSKSIVIDEAQRVPSVGLLLKRLVDVNVTLEKPVGICAAASSDLGLAFGVRESALGRIREYGVWPLSAAEIAACSGWTNTLRDIGTQIVYGTLPEIWTEPEKAQENLLNYCRGLLFKDLLDLSGIRYSPKFDALVFFLAQNIGATLSYDAIARETGLNKRTVLSYLRLLEQCFVIKVCGSYSNNLSSEMRKGKKIYFVDTGIRNAIVKDFRPLSGREDAEALWENFFFMERVKYHSIFSRQTPTEIYFWRTTANRPHEIDFVEVDTLGNMRAFECRLSPNAKARGAETFSAAYPHCPVEVVSPRDLMRLWQEAEGKEGDR